MYAVIATGGKQYRVAEGDVVQLEKLEGEPGAAVEFDKVLMVGQGADVRIGKPYLRAARSPAPLSRTARPIRSRS